MPVAGGGADGRVLRGIRNRDAVVEAFLSLIEEGVPRPTAREIAARAGLSRRSVFHHFDDLEQIYEAAGRRQFRLLKPLLEPLDPSLPLDCRLTEFVRRRREMLERLDPVARAARIREPFSLQLQANREVVVEMMRDQCRAVFAPELEESARSAARSPDRLLAALATSSSWSNWYHLRNDQGLDADAAAEVMLLLLSGVLERAVLLL